MRRIYILALSLILLIGYNHAQFKRANRQWKFDSCNQVNMDDCAQRLYMFGYRNINETTAVRNLNEMKDYCQETREAEKCTKDWGRKCLATFQRQCLNLLVSGASQSRRSLCTTKGQQRFLLNRQCFIKTVNDQHNCMDQFKIDISKSLLIDKTQFSVKLQCGCCFADKWLKCFRESAKKVCDNTGIKFLEWVVEPYVADAMDLGCKKDWTHGSETCTKTIGKLPALLENNFNVSKSIMFPLYSILSEFTETQDNKGFQFKS